MIREDYVSFEIAKLLKEKGFDEACHAFYDSGHRHILKFVQNSLWNNAGVVANNGICVAPTLQMAMKWLREAHEIFIRPNINFLYPIKYYCEIFCYGDNLKAQQDVTTENFKSLEEACEAAIKYCLEKLI